MVLSVPLPPLLPVVGGVVVGVVGGVVMGVVGGVVVGLVGGVVGLVGGVLCLVFVGDELAEWPPELAG
jgi:hypothetical protein